MTKKQKTWLAIGLGLFIIPEIIWSPEINLIYGFIADQPLRDNALMSSDARGNLILVTFIQLLGIAGSFYILSRDRVYKEIKAGRAMLIVVGFLSLINLIMLYILFATKNFAS